MILLRAITYELNLEGNLKVQTKQKEEKKNLDGLYQIGKKKDSSSVFLECRIHKTEMIQPRK